MRYGLTLVKLGAEQPRKVLEAIRKVEGVIDAYAVFGRFDIAVFIEAGDYDGLKDVAAGVAGVPGIKSTETLVHGD